jgi:hypothetical protein
VPVSKLGPRHQVDELNDVNQSGPYNVRERWELQRRRMIRGVRVVSCVT